MDTIRTSNKGYSAELFVVTFNPVKESVDNGSKVHILLVSFHLKYLHPFSPLIICTIMLHSISCTIQLIQYLMIKRKEHSTQISSAIPP